MLLGNSMFDYGQSIYKIIILLLIYIETTVFLKTNNIAHFSGQHQICTDRFSFKFTKVWTFDTHISDVEGFRSRVFNDRTFERRRRLELRHRHTAEYKTSSSI